MHKMSTSENQIKIDILLSWDKAYHTSSLDQSSVHTDNHLRLEELRQSPGTYISEPKSKIQFSTGDQLNWKRKNGKNRINAARAEIL